MKRYTIYILDEPLAVSYEEEEEDVKRLHRPVARQRFACLTVKYGV